MAKTPRSATHTDARSSRESAGTIDKLDKQLVEEGVAWIRSKLAETLFLGMSEIGAYVLDRFFGGDPERARSKDPTKNASFRSLVKRCESTDLPIGRSALQRAVWVAVMIRALPKDATAYPKLPPAHQVALLPLREPVIVERLAERALSRRLSVRALREAVTHEVAKTPLDGGKRGRPPKPLIVKTLDKTLSLFTLDSGRRSFTKAHLAELSDKQTTYALKRAEDLIGSLKQLVDKLRERSDVGSTSGPSIR